MTGREDILFSRHPRNFNITINFYRKLIYLDKARVTGRKDFFPFPSPEKLQIYDQMYNI